MRKCPFPLTAARFRGDETAVAGIEFAIIAPVLIFLFLASATLFDAFHVRQMTERASYTVNDLVTRQMEVSDKFFGNIYALLPHLIPVPADDIELRVSSIERLSDRLTVGWSQPYGFDDSKLEEGDIPNYDLPPLAVGDSFVLTEIKVDIDSTIRAASELGLDLSSIVVHRPRFISRIDGAKLVECKGKGKGQCKPPKKPK